MQSEMSIRDRNTFLLLILQAVIAGTLYPVCGYVLQYATPFTATFLRYCICSASMTLIQRIRFTHTNKRPCKIKKRDMRSIVMIGFFGFVFCVVLQQYGITLTSSSTTSILAATTPIFISLAAVIMLREYLQIQKIICILCAVIGTFFVVFGRELTSGNLAGVLMVVISVISWAFTSVLMRKVSRIYDPFTVSTYAIYVAAVCMAPVALWDLIHHPEINLFRLEIWLPCFYLGVVGTGGAHFLWNFCLSRMEASTCSMFYPIQPLTAVIISVIFLKEQITAGMMIGAIFIVGSILYFSLWSRLGTRGYAISFKKEYHHE